METMREKIVGWTSAVVAVALLILLIVISVRAFG